MSNANSTNSGQSVSLTTNACLTDSPFLEKALRHITRSLDYPFTERLIALDKSQPTGGFQKRQRADEDQLLEILDRLLEDNLFDRIDEVPWTLENQNQIFKKYFNQKDLDSRCSHGTAVYQYLFAMDQCKGDYILHVDSDILFTISSGSSWIAEGIALMRERPDVVFVSPIHPPRAQTFLEFLLGKPLNRKANRWILSQSASTRYFLADKKRLEQKLLPLVRADFAERLEESFNRTLKAKQLWKGTFNSKETWVIHPKPHNQNYINHLDTLIWAVENHVYPFRRPGRYPWNLYTYTRHLRPWLRAARRARKSLNSYASS